MCVDVLGAFSSGCSNDSSVKVKIDMLIQQLTSVMQSHQTNISNVFMSNQSISLTVGPTGVMNCSQGLNLSNTLNGNFSFVSKVDNEMVSDIQNLISTNIENQLNNVNSTQQALLSSALNGKTASDLSTSLQSLVKNVVTLSSLTNLCNEVNPTQTISLNINGLISGSSCNLSNNMFITILASNIVSNVSNAIARNSDIITLNNALSQTATASSTGLTGFIQAVGSFLTSMTFAYVILAGIIVIGAVFLLRTLLAPENAETMRMLTDTANKGIAASSGMKR